VGIDERRSPDGMTYDAFISYSRLNTAEAAKIERDLERFPLPRDVRKQLGQRRLNVFRDVSDMTGNRLDPSLDVHLANSRTLVVLCSPAARQSHYVNQEISRFAELRDPEHIVPVLVAGGPNNDPHVDAADWAFPDALEHVLGGAPLAANLSQAWTTKRRRAKLAQGSPWVQLVAGIVDSTTDDLTQRIARSERRRLQSIGTAGKGLSIEVVYQAELTSEDTAGELVKALNRLEGVQSVSLLRQDALPEIDRRR